MKIAFLAAFLTLAGCTATPDLPPHCAQIGTCGGMENDSPRRYESSTPRGHSSPRYGPYLHSKNR